MEKTTLVMTLRCDVPDITTAKNFVSIVKAKVADHPEIAVTSHISIHLDLEETLT